MKEPGAGEPVSVDKIKGIGQVLPGNHSFVFFTAKLIRIPITILEPRSLVAIHVITCFKRLLLCPDWRANLLADLL